MFLDKCYVDAKGVEIVFCKNEKHSNHKGGNKSVSVENNFVRFLGTYL